MTAKGNKQANPKVLKKNNNSVYRVEQQPAAQKIKNGTGHRLKNSPSHYSKPSKIRIKPRGGCPLSTKP